MWTIEYISKKARYRQLFSIAVESLYENCICSQPCIPRHHMAISQAYDMICARSSYAKQS